MKNFNKNKINKDAMVMAKNHKDFSIYLEASRTRVRMAVEVYNSRTMMGMTQKQLAENASTTQKMISKIENGDIDLGINLESRLFRALNFTSENLSRIFGCSHLSHFTTSLTTSRAENSYTKYNIHPNDFILKDKKAESMNEFSISGLN